MVRADSSLLARSDNIADAAPRPVAHSSPLEPSDPTDDDIADCAAAISKVARSTGFARRIEVGGLILDRIFAPDRGERSVRQASSHSSFRRLAEALDGAMSKSELYRCAMVCQLCRRFPFITATPHVTVSHVEAVDGLSMEDQERLLRETDIQHWSVRQLRQAKQELLPATSRARTRAASTAIRRVTSLKLAVVNELRAIATTLHELDEQDAAGRPLGLILDQLAALSNACSACASSLHRPTLTERYLPLPML